MPTQKGPQYYECVCPPMISGEYCTGIVKFTSSDDCKRYCVSGQGHCVLAADKVGNSFTDIQVYLYLVLD